MNLLSKPVYILELTIRQQRKELFRVLVMNRELGYDKLLSIIKEFKCE